MQSKGIHPNVSDYQMSLKMPGYMQMQDAGMSFSHRETTAYVGDRSNYGPNQSAHIYISSQGLLDPNNCYIQANITMPKQYLTSVIANSNNAGKIMDQLASSLIRRVLVRVAGRTLCDVQLFNIYHHIMMQTERYNEDRKYEVPNYGFYTKDTSQNQAYVGNTPGVAGAAVINVQNTVLWGEPNLKNQFISQIDQNVVDNGNQRYDYLIGERFQEDALRWNKYYKLATAPGNDNTVTNLNVFSNPREQTEPSTMSIFFKLSDLPCFSSKQYFPTWLLSSVMDIQIDFEDSSRCFHDLFYKHVGGTVEPSTLVYSVNNLQMIAGIIYPNEEYKRTYIQDRVVNGMALYKCQYVEGSNINIQSQTGSIVISTSAKRLSQSIHCIRENGSQIDETRRTNLLTNDQSSTPVFAVGQKWRGSKWLSPFGNIGFISTRLLGVTYPQAQASVLTSEQTLLEQVEESMGQLCIRDKNRFFFDTQFYVQNYKIDPDQPLVDVSGIDSSSAGQLFFIYSMNNTQAYAANTELISFIISEQILMFNLDGSIQQLR